MYQACLYIKKLIQTVCRRWLWLPHDAPRMVSRLSLLEIEVEDIFELGWKAAGPLCRWWEGSLPFWVIFSSLPLTWCCRGRVDNTGWGGANWKGGGMGGNWCRMARMGKFIHTGSLPSPLTCSNPCSYPEWHFEKVRNKFRGIDAYTHQRSLGGESATATKFSKVKKYNHDYYILTI